MTTTLIQVDSRKRVSLGKLAHHDQYIVTEENDGRLILEPAVVLTVAERNFLNDPELVEALNRVNDDSTSRRTRQRRSSAAA